MSANPSTYFKTTPLHKWNTTQCVEYFKSKHRIDVTAPNQPDGRWFSTAKLKQLRSVFGKSTGEKVYIIVRDRLDREDEVLQSPALTPLQSPMMSPVQMPVQIHIPRVLSSNRIKATSDTSSGIFSDMSRDVTTPAGKNHLVMSDLVLNSVKLDFGKTDQQAARHLHDLKKKEDSIYSRYEHARLLSFIKQHPPLLWQDSHLKVFLAEYIGIEADNIPDAGDFIFMQPDELDLYFPNKGLIIYSSIRRRFINPDIKKLAKYAKCL